MRDLLQVMAAAAVILVSGCSDAAPYEPGTIPTSLMFRVVRVSDSVADGVYTQRSVSEAIDVGRLAPDFFDGSVAVWRYRTVFGDLVEEPGASIEFQRGGTTLIKADPWRTSFGAEYCLVVGRDGRAMSQWVNVEAPHADLESGWDRAEVRLRLDASGLAAHRHLGVLRVEVLLAGRTVRTLTEDDFHDGSWRLEDADGRRARTWSLRRLADDHVGRVVSIRGRDGSPATIASSEWADSSRIPVLRLEDGVMVFRWADQRGSIPSTVEVWDVTAICFERE